MLREGPDSDVGDMWLVTLGLDPFRTLDEGDDAVFAWMVLVGFLGLIAVVVLSVVVCASTIERGAGTRRVVLARTLVALAAVGTLIAGVIMGRAIDVYDMTIGPGYPSLAAGIVVMAVLITRRLTALWAPHHF